MVEVKLLAGDARRVEPRHQDHALELAQRFSSLILSAKEIAANVMHGVHGRRRSGSGETFWQFRPFTAGEAASRIDWRRSGRDDRLYVREREWEAAHSVFIWMDRSPSMGFVSKLALQPKIDRALVLGLAAADLLISGGERVGLLGLTPALGSRNIIERFAEVLHNEESAFAYQPLELPVAAPLPRGAQAILLGDFLNEPEAIRKTIETFSAQGARGHLLMIADPIEETFPFTGHTEFIDVDSSQRLRIGQAQSFREDYIRRLGEHREAIARIARSRGWSLMLHRTDKPASEALLALRMQLSADLGAGAGAGKAAF
jgi:uncharacterized protein (DUF58 family)